MYSLKVVVIVVAIFTCLVLAKDNNGNKCPKNSPHLAPCTQEDGSPGVCRNNGVCTLLQCTKFCRDPITTAEPSTTPGPTTTFEPTTTFDATTTFEPTTTFGPTTTFDATTPSVPDCTTLDITMFADFTVSSGAPVFTTGGSSLSPGSSDTIDCGSATLEVTYTCAADGGLFLESIDCV